MANGPQIRGSWTKLTLATVKQLPASERDPVLDSLAVTRAALREVGIAAWVPADLHLDVGEAIERELGASKARAIHRDVLLRAFESVLLRPIMTGATRLHGRHPGSVLRMAPKVHWLIARRAGEMTVPRLEDGDVEIVLGGLPDVFRTRTSFLLSYQATCDAVLAHLGVEGTVERNDEELVERGVSRISVRW